MLSDMENLIMDIMDWNILPPAAGRSPSGPAFPIAALSRRGPAPPCQVPAQPLDSPRSTAQQDEQTAV